VVGWGVSKVCMDVLLFGGRVRRVRVS
jgi:hypothetical protein